MPSDDLKLIKNYASFLGAGEDWKGLFRGIENHGAKVYLDAFSDGQVQSKRWMLDEIKKSMGTELGNVFVLAGWVGVLGQLILRDKDLNVNRVRSFDRDPATVDQADDLNREFVMQDWKFKAIHMDIHELDLENSCYVTKTHKGVATSLLEDSDLIINSSCEHIDQFSKWWKWVPSGKAVVLQSNDFFEHHEHVNCVKGIEEFKEQAPMSKVLYSGALNLAKYKRYMLIGYR